MSSVKNVAIVGATGSVGRFIVDELLKGGKHTITAVTRADSTAKFPEGIKLARVNYDDHASLVAALKGQEVLIITMSVRAPPGTQAKLIDAAADANVPWILPNEWGGDQTDEAFGDATFLGPASRAARKHIEERGKSSWIGIATGFWYEFSLGGGSDRYGFDFEKRSVTFYDDGTVPLNTSTWPQVGRAVARLLSLQTEPNGNNTVLSSFKNKFVCISSFCVSQKDMFESVLRVTGTRPEDWEISNENSTERYQNGVKAMQNGDMSGFVRALYVRAFYPGAPSAYEKTKQLHNDVLGLPKEDIDEFTKAGIERRGLRY